jgi:Fe-S cluster assembly protein SufB
MLKIKDLHVKLEEEIFALVVNGFDKDVLQVLPIDFALEAQQLVAISLKGAVG